MVAVLCALGAALLYAAASVLQQRSAAAQAEEHMLRLGLLTRLLRQPLWVLGIVADAAGYVLQFIAVQHGALVVVQPLMVSGLLFALPIGAHLGGSRLRAVDWASAAAVCVGLGGFLVVADPAAGRSYIPTSTWVPLLVGGLGAGVVLAAAGRVAAGRRRAVLLSASAGVIYGIAAGLTKTTAAYLSADGLGFLAHWQTWALVAVGVGGMVVAQSAFQAGSLDVSLPTMTAIDPVVSIAVGAFAFSETIPTGAGALSVEILAIAVMILGLYGLARSPAIRRTRQGPGASPVPSPGAGGV